MASLKEQNPLVVANFVIDLSIKEKNLITNLQLQKILFFLQGYCLHEYNKPIIKDNFSKWQYGPVVEAVYQEFKDNGSEKITDKAIEFNITDDIFSIEEYGPLTSDDVGGNDNLSKIQSVTKKLIKIDPWFLVEMTHEHSSWKKYELDISKHESLQYTNTEIKSCLEENMERLRI